ncbi:MAG TPA: multidrug effflux MFS transporter [Burkholderiales bacterium]|nr:multidrug effflux MFS transporter [Burkholderiales bacterium]
MTVASAPAAHAPPSAGAAFAHRRSFVLTLAALSMLGPFSIDTFLPSLIELQSSLHASPLEAQQALSAYLLGFALMSLWHGAISDAFGRRPVILASLYVYIAAALVCTFAPSIQVLIAARLVQGLAGGAGMIVARAIIRDCFEGVRALRLMATMMQIFSIAPAIAPIIGGYLQSGYGWRSVFAFMLVNALLVLAWVWRALPETLPPHARHPLHPATLARSYWRVFTRMEFQLLAGLLGISFSSLFIYITASPAFMIRHLHLTETDFGLLFLPVIGGMVLGSMAASRLAGKVEQRRLMGAGFIVMGVGMAINLGLQFALAPQLAPGPWLTFVSIAPLGLIAFGQALLGPSAQMMVMDLYPAQRGLMSSCQGFTHLMVSTITAGIVAPLVADTLQHLVLASVAFYTVALALWLAYLALRRK